MTQRFDTVIEEVRRQLHARGAGRLVLCLMLMFALVTALVPAGMTRALADEPDEPATEESATEEGRADEQGAAEEGSSESAPQSESEPTPAPQLNKVQEAPLMSRITAPTTAPTDVSVVEIAFRDGDGNFIPASASDTEHNYNFVGANATASVPVCKNANSIEVAVTAKELVLEASKAVLVDKDGNEIAQASFEAAYEEDETTPIAWTYVAKLEHPTSDSTAPLPEQAVGVKVIAKDTDGHQLECENESDQLSGTDKYYRLYGAKVKEFDVGGTPTKKIYADESLVLDRTAPVLQYMMVKHSSDTWFLDNDAVGQNGPVTIRMSSAEALMDQTASKVVLVDRVNSAHSETAVDLSWDGNAKTLRFDIPDGVWDVKYQLVDAAGNVGSAGTYTNVIVDTEPADVSFTYNGEAVASPDLTNYYDEFGTAKITIKEPLLDKSASSIKVYEDHSLRQTIEANDWTYDGGITYTYEVDIDAEAVWGIDVITKDTLGNININGSAENHSWFRLTIDFAPPEVMVAYVDENDNPATPVASSSYPTVAPEKGFTYERPLDADIFDAVTKVRCTVSDTIFDWDETKVYYTENIVLAESVANVIAAGDNGITAGGITVKLVEDKDDGSLKTITFDIIYPNDGVYIMPTVTAKDRVHDKVTKKPSDADYVMVDATAPILSANLSKDPFDLGKDADGNDIENGRLTGSGGTANAVWFFKTDEAAALSLALTETCGIRSFELVDPSGRYALSSLTGDAKTNLNNALATGNAGLTGMDTETSFTALTVAEVLEEAKDFSDSVTVTVTDFAGHSTTWTLSEGLATPSSTIAADKATLLVEDDTDPTLSIVTGIESKAVSDAAGENPAYVRYFNENKTLGIEVSDLTIKYLRGFAGKTEGDQYEDINSYYAGLDTDRPVVTIKKDGSAVSPLTVSNLDPDSSDNGKDYSLTHVFDADGDYEVSLEARDVTGNKVTDTIEKFTIDKTAPTIDVSYNNNDVLNGKYYKDKRTATIKVVEHNFDPALFTVAVSFEAHEKGLTAPVVSWATGANPDEHIGTVVFADDGAYTLKVTGMDMACNEATAYDSGEFVIDTDLPTIAEYLDSAKDDSATFDADAPEVEMPKPSGVLGGTNYYAHAISLLAKVKDRNFDTTATELKLKKDGSETAQSVSWGRSPDELGENGYEFWNTTIAVDEDGEYETPHITAVDLAGNSDDNGSKTRKFVIDLKPPTVKVNVDKKPASQGKKGNDPVNFYNQQTKMTFTVSDEHKLRSVEIVDPDGVYNVGKAAAAAEGKGSVTFTVSLKDGTVPKDNEYQRDIVLTAIDLAGNERTWTIDHTGKIKKDEKVSGAWKQVTSSDANVGINGKDEHPLSLVQDTVAPVVGLSGVEAGKYYNKPQTVTATVNELNLDWLKQFDPSRVVVTVTKYEGKAGRAKSTWTIPASSFTGSKPNYSFPQAFSSDGHYVVEAQFADYATNLSNKATIGEFTIDMTPPQITMEFDNKDVRNGKYYKAARTATITVTEHNFDPSLITIEAEGGTVGGWSNNGDTHTVTVYFGEGGPYTVKVSGKDMADNAAMEVSEPEFIVDLTPPEVKIAGTAQRLGYVGDSSYAVVDGNSRINAYHGDLEDQSAYNGVVVPVITYTDNEELATDDLSFMLAGSKHGEDIEVESVTSEPGKEMTTTLADIGYQAEGPADGSNWQAFYVDDYSIDADDIYTIKAKLSDQAGNEAEGELTFSVNRFGSNYDVRLKDLEEDELAEYQKSGMLSTSPTIVVREINVSGVEKDSDHRVEKEFANATTAIKRADNEATGYSLRTIDPRQATNGWSEYVYTVRNTNFGEGSDSDHDDRGQGVYRVNVTSDDTASNANTTADYWRSNKARTKATAEGATAEFILDELGPTIDDVDLPEHLERGTSYEASFHVTDDITSGNTIEVLVDGVKLAAGEVQGPSNGAGTFTFQIPAKAFNWNRAVKIVVRDYAGREVSESNHTWMWLSSFIPEVGTVVGALAVVAVGIAALLRRKAAAEPELPEW